MPRYTNLDGTTPDKGPGDIFRWQVIDRLRGRRPAQPGPFEPPRGEPDRDALHGAAAHLTWVGHATFLARLGGKTIATDPVWSTRLHTIPRVSAPGLALEDAPRIDVVTVSHSHYDHLDLPTLARIGGDALYVVPKDNADILTGAGLRNVVELGWWESHRIGDLRVTLVPSHHWSMRTPWDKNKRLWGGFVYEGPEGTAYHAGDTAMSEQVFTRIGERFPSIDWAMLPIGAYEPAWFMQPQHMNPDEAVRAFELLGAKTLVAMHWGTFRLTDEPLAEPPARARTRFRERGHGEDRLWVMALGETRRLGA